MTAMRAFPDRAACNIRVNLESLKGMCAELFKKKEDVSLALNL
jgi:hypothetical protein